MHSNAFGMKPSSAECYGWISALSSARIEPKLVKQFFQRFRHGTLEVSEPKENLKELTVSATKNYSLSAKQRQILAGRIYEIEKQIDLKEPPEERIIMGTVLTGAEIPVFLDSALSDSLQFQNDIYLRAHRIFLFVFSGVSAVVPRLPEAYFLLPTLGILFGHGLINGWSDILRARESAANRVLADNQNLDWKYTSFNLKLAHQTASDASAGLFRNKTVRAEVDRLLTPLWLNKLEDRLSDLSHSDQARPVYVTLDLLHKRGETLASDKLGIFIRIQAKKPELPLGNGRIEKFVNEIKASFMKTVPVRSPPPRGGD
ncbi:MAG: hypothetical protein JWQ35_1071 [Bacteriovoracaceae bacterium]|nr:hypothetical protein [Bacteriovoracaceae bacterium]